MEWLWRKTVFMCVHGWFVCRVIWWGSGRGCLQLMTRVMWTTTTIVWSSRWPTSTGMSMAIMCGSRSLRCWVTRYETSAAVVIAGSVRAAVAASPLALRQSGRELCRCQHTRSRLLTICHSNSTLAVTCCRRLPRHQSATGCMPCGK